MTDFKDAILDNLRAMRVIERENKQPFKVRAYNNIIKQIEEIPNPISDFSQLHGVKGIGQGIHKKLQEIFANGSLSVAQERLDVAHNEKLIDEFTKVMSIGSVKARELVDKGITSLQDLREHTELLNDKQILGLKYHEDFEKRIPRTEMIKHDAFIKSAIASINPTIKVQVVGSFRRGSKSSGDIDVIISTEDENVLQSIVQRFKDVKYLVDDFAFGPHKYLGVCKLPRHATFRRIDLLYAANNVWPFSLLYFTGSMEFNVALRAEALSQGYTFNEYGIKYTTGKNKGQLVDHKFEEEVDIFKFLGYKYVAPEERSPGIDLNKYKI